MTAVQNALGIECPKCGKTNSLYAVPSEGDMTAYLGPWGSPEADAAAAEAFQGVCWNTAIVCNACGYAGPCESFKGEFASRLASKRKAWEELAKWLKEEEQYIEEEEMPSRPSDTAQTTGTIKVTRTSMITGKTTTLDLPITRQQLDAYLSGNVLLHDAFPDLAPPLREFIKTGVTPEEWQRCVLGPSSSKAEEE
jgi:hypothetical protein